jgi:hypothetical protein
VAGSGLGVSLRWFHSRALSANQAQSPPAVLLRHGGRKIGRRQEFWVRLRAAVAWYNGALDAFLILGLAGGVLGQLELTIPLRGDFEEGFRIYGEHGSVQGKVGGWLITHGVGGGSGGTSARPGGGPFGGGVLAGAGTNAE